ncbi:LysM domain-containing protein [Nonomuraea purpurea]|uniref:LysM domain-containing protein n=1 Tax=Nonomuraea purpurea TaxID=1849276 RepID=A0ABV8GMJ4_9ACTN
MFTVTSRYHGIETALHRPDGGEPIPYVRRRFLPDPRTLTVIAVHVVRDDDRLDRIAAQHLNDPERFWQVADANPVLDPADLTARRGRRLDIALPTATAGRPHGF